MIKELNILRCIVRRHSQHNYFGRCSNMVVIVGNLLSHESGKTHETVHS